VVYIETNCDNKVKHIIGQVWHRWKSKACQLFKELLIL